MPGVPLIFVEVAFASQMADDVQVLLDSTLPPQIPTRRAGRSFYSISNTQPGLKGISFGNFLLKRAVEQLLDERAQLKSFATLSPIPGFADWLGKLDAEAVEAIVREDKVRAKARKRSARRAARWRAWPARRRARRRRGAARASGWRPAICNP